MATVPISADTPSPSRPLPPLLALVRSAWEDPVRRGSVIGALGAVGLLGVLFWQNIFHFVMVWANDENYSHGFLVPLISLYFANEAARGAAAVSGRAATHCSWVQSPAWIISETTAPTSDSRGSR